MFVTGEFDTVSKNRCWAGYSRVAVGHQMKREDFLMILCQPGVTRIEHTSPTTSELHDFAPLRRDDGVADEPSPLEAFTRGMLHLDDQREHTITRTGRGQVPQERWRFSYARRPLRSR